MRTVISFDEGCSGNFLAALLSRAQVTELRRIDSHHNTQLNYSIIPKLDLYTGTPLKSIVVTHDTNSQQIKKILNADRIIRIEPITGIFTAIYNVFSKKLIDEDKEDILGKWPEHPAYCYDRTFEHIKDYYAKFSKNMWTSDEILFDFGWIFDDQKMLEFLNQNNIDANFNFVKQYQQSQFPLLLNLPDSTNMRNIVLQIPTDYFKQSPWFACYCIFSFEVKNNLNEHQRKWSINQLSLLGAEEIIALSLQYQL